MYTLCVTMYTEVGYEPTCNQGVSLCGYPKLVAESYRSGKLHMNSWRNTYPKGNHKGYPVTGRILTCMV